MNNNMKNFKYPVNSYESEKKNSRNCLWLVIICLGFWISLLGLIYELFFA